MKRMFKPSLLALALILSVSGCGTNLGHHPNRLTFRADGSFTIVQFTDTHLHYPDSVDQHTYELMDLVLRLERPDLIVLTGDIARLTDEPESKPTWPMLVNFLDGTGIPWAYVYGNHDAELSGYARMDSVLGTARHGLYRPGLPGLSSPGNYVLPVYRHEGKEIGALLWCLNSGMESEESSGYGWVREDQIAWFRAEADRLMGDRGDKITGLAFFHIPLQQYRTVWDTQVCTGYKHENVSPQGKDVGLFDAFRERGRVVACFVGHDHVNDYEGTLDGVSLCFGRGSGYRAYGREGFERGARVIVLREGQRGYTSHIRLADGSLADRSVHQPGTPDAP